MDAQKFIQTLHSIGYPNVHKLKPRDLDWAFENPATLPFLSWFTDSVGADNVLTSKELHDFKNIEESRGVLEKRQLEEALESIRHGRNAESPEDLESEVEKLEISVGQAREKKKTLVCRRNKLSVQQMKCKDRALKMKEIEQHTRRTMKKATDECAMQDVKLNKTLHQLSVSVGRLSELYRSSPDNETKKSCKPEGHFLSQLDLGAFHDAEAKYSHDLTAFTKRHFFEGVSQMSGEGGPASQYALLDLKSPHKGSIAEPDKEKAFLNDCEEMQRLQLLFPRSECDRINALVNAKKAHSAVGEAAALLESLKAGHFPTSTAEINHLHKSLDTSIEKAVGEAQPLLAALPGLLRELGHLQGGEVLTGDYDLKLRRQEYFTHKQDQVISHLVAQRARAEFLSLLYELELRCHRQTHVLLGAVRQVLAGHHTAWAHRMDELQDADLSKARFQGRVVDARDTSMLTLFHLLGECETDSCLLCVQKQKVVEKAKHLHAQHTCAKAADQTTEEKYTNRMGQLEGIVQECEGHLYAGSSTSSGQPMWTPSEVQEKMAGLGTSLAALEKDLAGVISDLDKKKTDLKMNVLQIKERELFMFFHTDPKRLEYTVKTLEEKAQAIE